MKSVRYTKFTGDLASEVSMEDLLKALSDYLLDSGFQNPFAEFQDLEQTMDDLREALRRALEQGDAFDESLQQKIDQMAADGKLDELIEKLIERMERENYISTQTVAGVWAGFASRGATGRAADGSALRGDGQEPRFSGIQDAAGFAGVAGEIEFWAARYAALGDGRGDERRIAAV